MNFNSVDIDIATDYTAFTNTVTFSLTVPVSETDATAIYKSMLDSKWSDTETAITTAITNSAPEPVQTLATTLMNAYTGKTASTGDTPADPAPTDPTDGGDAPSDTPSDPAS
ncbi:hypothetical protein V5T82_13110 [Magnetovibrio sp. PR-2]|uniref:hypothetical protein n=1 Tax=Magnetovibrio sp. PR-2 TaxID=3120356 RepID=UPI002FCE1AEB